MTAITFEKPRHHGFTLVEMAIVLLIIGLLLGGLLPTISSQVDQRRVTDTNRQLDEIREALLGFAIANGRLPCPAAPNTTGLESFATGHSAADGQCSNPYNGFVPASTLGLAGTDSAGYAIDAWGNRIHYAVTQWTNTFTKNGGISAKGVSNLSPDLLVCSTATGISGTSCNGNSLTASPGVPIVIFSTGKNGPGSAGPDEAANLDGNQSFVSHTYTPSSSANGEFDDIVTWVSSNVLINRMVKAGALP